MARIVSFCQKVQKQLPRSVMWNVKCLSYIFPSKPKLEFSDLIVFIQPGCENHTAAPRPGGGGGGGWGGVWGKGGGPV